MCLGGGGGVGESRHVRSRMLVMVILHREGLTKADRKVDHTVVLTKAMRTERRSVDSTKVRSTDGPSSPLHGVSGTALSTTGASATLARAWHNRSTPVCRTSYRLVQCTE